MIAQMIEPAIDVVVANPRDVEKLDLNQIYNHVWFIGDYACKEGTMALITGKEDKLMFIKQGLKHPEMVSKGKLNERV